MQTELLEELKKLYRDGFPEDSEPSVEWFFSRVLEENAMYFRASDVSTQIISAGYIMEKPAMLWGKHAEFPYLSALSTLFEYRGKGRIRPVIAGLLSRLYQRKHPCCALYPFNHEYYKKYGFCDISFCTDKTSVGGKRYAEAIYLPDDVLPASVLEELVRIQTEFAEPFHNRLRLGAKEIADKRKEFSAESIPLCVYSDRGVPFAYCFKSNEKVYHYAASDLDKFLACEPLKGFSFADFYGSTRPYVQGRIVNARVALKSAPYMPDFNQTVTLRVVDSMIAENSRIFTVTKGNGTAMVRETDRFPDQTLDIAELTELLFIGDGKMIQKQKNIFTDQY